MPKLTVPAIAKIKAGEQRREIRDIGAPGLRLVVQTSGSLSWAVRFRRPDGKSAKLTLGPYVAEQTADDPVLGGALTLPQARELAARVDRQRKLGKDVVGEHKADRERKRVEHITRTDNSFGTLLPEFFRDHKTKWGARPRRWRGDARILGLRWEPGADPTNTEPEIVKGGLADRWRDRPVVSVEGHDIYAIVDESRKLGIPGVRKRNRGISDARGRKMHAALSVFFRWLLQHRLVNVNPCVGVWHPGAPPRRQRVLSNAEIRWLWMATEQISEPFGAAVKLLLLSGGRKQEVVGMRRDELHHKDIVGDWLIPKSRAKNHLPHLLPLPPQAREINASVPIIESGGRRNTGLLFTTTGKTPISGWSKCKRQLNAAMLAIAHEEDPSAIIEPWRLHDLRRTCSTGMSALGIMPHITEAVLNHVSGAKAGVAGTYNVYEYYPEKKAALLRWSQHLAGLVYGKVAALRASR